MTYCTLLPFKKQVLLPRKCNLGENLRMFFCFFWLMFFLTPEICPNLGQLETWEIFWGVYFTEEIHPSVYTHELFIVFLRGMDGLRHVVNIYIPGPSKGCQLNPEGWWHPLGTIWHPFEGAGIHHIYLSFWKITRSEAGPALFLEIPRGQTRDLLQSKIPWGPKFLKVWRSEFWSSVAP